MFNCDEGGGVDYEMYYFQRFLILAYMLLRTITNEREDILKVKKKANKEKS